MAAPCCAKSATSVLNTPKLSHGTRLGLMPGILEAVDAGEIKISSLHNFCPLPMGVTRASPNLYQFSAENPRERELAVKHTLKTLEFAGRVKAPVVVLHLGSLELKDYTGKLCEMLEKRRERIAPIRKTPRRSRRQTRGQKETVRRTGL